MNNKKKLELTWIGKDDRPKLEPRVLVEDPDKSYHAKQKVTDNDIYDNRLIFGDNLLALKALEQEFTGKIKCIYIDPPYNTGEALEYYDDGLEHSIWLGLMRERLITLRSLLTNDGVLFCQLNDDEAAYCKVLLDEIFTRNCFLNQVSVRMKQTAGASGGGEDKKLKKNIEYILIYTKDINSFNRFNEVLEEEDLFVLIDEMRENNVSWKYTRAITDFGTKEYLKTIEDGSGEPIRIYTHQAVVIKPLKEIMAEDSLTEEECYYKYFDRIFRDTNAQSSIRTRIIDATEGEGNFFSIEYMPKSGRSKGKVTTLYYLGRNRDLITWLSDVAQKRTNRIVKLEKIGTYWEGFPLNNLTKEGNVRFPKGKKPEALISRILDLATQKGDWVLDSFAGSGTTGAVAHKMSRKWIMIELKDHCHTHIIPRMQKVIDGSDQGGISKAVDWKGGGGFRYYRLAPSLLEKDKWGNWVINREYNKELLAEAVCKLEGFTYAPSDTVFWQHGHSTESDFIYVTTQNLTQEQLRLISEEVGEERTLLILCPAFQGDASDYGNLTVKKIPKQVLNKCEYGKDDYSLNVQNLPQMDKPEKQSTWFDEGEEL